MKKIVYGLLIIICLFIVVGCNQKNNETNTQDTQNSQQENNNYELNNSNEVIKSVKAIINGKEYKIDLEDNETVKDFVNLLPQEFTMNELNGNEKYVYMDNSLKTNSYNPDHVEKGDVMLYGDNCLVIFYESFDTSYSYTKIGHIDNLPDLGEGNITIKFEK